MKERTDKGSFDRISILTCSAIFARAASKFEAIVESDGERKANEGGFRICVANIRRRERAQKKLNIYTANCELRARVAPSMNMQEVGIGKHLNVLGPAQLVSLNDHSRSTLRLFFIGFEMGNGAKAQQKRERNAEKGAAKGSKSQSKVNEAAKSIICSTCRQSFFITTRAPALEEHAQNKHSKTMADCFPGVKA
ncbi:hypothetical protein EYR36_007202 [Pleurotus pulmonarius]|nr:hypothetical protein EYR36_007202 [Pleurotus pulmonarius]